MVCQLPHCREVSDHCYQRLAVGLLQLRPWCLGIEQINLVKNPGQFDFFTNNYEWTLIHYQQACKMSRKIKKSRDSIMNRYQMVIDNCGRKDCEMTGDLDSKILFGRMNLYSFLIWFDTFYFAISFGYVKKISHLIFGFYCSYLRLRVDDFEPQSTSFM